MTSRPPAAAAALCALVVTLAATPTLGAAAETTGDLDIDVHLVRPDGAAPEAFGPTNILWAVTVGDGTTRANAHDITLADLPIRLHMPAGSWTPGDTLNMWFYDPTAMGSNHLVTHNVAFAADLTEYTFVLTKWNALLGWGTTPSLAPVMTTTSHQPVDVAWFGGGDAGGLDLRLSTLRQSSAGNLVRNGYTHGPTDETGHADLLMQAPTTSYIGLGTVHGWLPGDYTLTVDAQVPSGAFVHIGNDRSTTFTLGAP